MKGLIALGLAVILALVALPSLSLAQEDVDVVIESLSESGAFGTATLLANDDGQTSVAVAVGGLEADSSHVSHIHEGSGCGDGEYSAIVDDLTNVVADENGDGSSNTVVDRALEEVADGGHVIVIHAGATLEEDATPIACGAIPQLAGTEEPAPTPTVEAASTVVVPSAGTGGLLGQDGSTGVQTALLAAVAAVGVLVLAAGLVAHRRSR